MASFDGKVVAILGAASAIGAAAAELYAKQGAFLFLCDLEEEEDTLNSVANRCGQAGCTSNKTCVITGDPADERVQEIILKVIKDRFDCLDVLVNAVETKTYGSPIPGISMGDFNSTVDKNLKSVANVCFSALQLLRNTKGNIVNVSSCMSHKPVRNHLSYCVSKAGLDMLTKCLALDLASHGIRVNSVNPGVLDTDQGSDMEEFLKASATKTPMGRLAKVEEVAEAIVFLSSAKASFTTGQLLDVDGGAGL